MFPRNADVLRLDVRSTWPVQGGRPSLVGERGGVARGRWVRTEVTR